MGAWGAGSFDNDDAGDWVWELADADTSILEDAFARVIEADDDLEAPDCSVGVAAAEVVAALRRRPADQIPEEVAAFVTRIGELPSADLISASLQALKRIKTKSELQELWDKSETRTEWHEALAELEGRLK